MSYLIIDSALRLSLPIYGDRTTGQGVWDGRVSGHAVPPGLYAIVARTIDRVSKVGVSPPLGPAPTEGGRGRNGVVVRYLAARAALAPVAAGASTAVAVEAGSTAVQQPGAALLGQPPAAPAG